MFPYGHSVYLRFEGSDHRPLLTAKKKRGTFRFDWRLRKNPEIRDLVKSQLPHPAPESVISKTNMIGGKIIEWTKEQNAKSNEVIKWAHEQLEEALSSVMPDLERISSVTHLLEKAYVEEEEYWKQRSRIQWLQSGYFHAVTRGRRQVNMLSIMEDDKGTHYLRHWRRNREDHIRVNPVHLYVLWLWLHWNSHETLTPCISDEDNSHLTTIPDKEEVRRAVFAIHTYKAPGPDGFSAGFYNSYWDIIGEDICRDIRELF